MTRSRLRPILVGLAAAVVTIAIGVGVGLAIISVARPGLGETAVTTATPAALATPAASLPAPSAPGVSPSSSGSPSGGAIQMPVGGNCLACHTTAGGGVGTAIVPPIGHPLEGWTSCTSCHSNDRLVKTAPGHVGIHAEQCLLCHTATTPAAVDRPHSLTKNANCLSCHGSLAPLPASMRNRSGTTCWLCHQGSGVEAPEYAHRTPTDGKCLTCHVAGKVGALPTDHSTRTDVMCLACHNQSKTAAPSAPHPLADRVGMCEFCHGQASPKP